MPKEPEHDIVDFEWSIEFLIRIDKKEQACWSMTMDRSRRRDRGPTILGLPYRRRSGDVDVAGPESEASKRAKRRDTTLVRRWLLLWGLMFWQGGFMFYGGVVVPVGIAVLGSEREQGFITRSVTNYLNAAGAVALALWCWDISAGRAMSPGGRRLRWATWSGLVLSLALLAWLHMRLDELLDPENGLLRDGRRFRTLHEPLSHRQHGPVGRMPPALRVDDPGMER